MAIQERNQSHNRDFTPRASARSTALALFGGAVAPIAVLLWLLPAPLILPAFSILSILMAVIIGAVAYMFDRDGGDDSVTDWDIAAAFMLVGCTAGLLGDPLNALQLVGEALVDR